MTLPTSQFRRATSAAPRASFVWRARDLSLNALTGQVGTLVRATTAAATDSASVSLTCVRERPRWEVSNVGAATERTNLHLGAAAGALTEYASWPCGLTPGALSILLSFVENDTITIGDASGGGAGLFAISNDAVTTGPYLTVYADTNGKYAIGHDNDVSAVNSAQTGPAPTSGQTVLLRCWLYSDGKVQLWQSINAAAETASTVTGTLALGSRWGTAGSAAKYWLNTLGTAGLAYGHVLMNGVVVVPGNQSQATLLQALAY